jgi:Bacterial type II and III secretion system protein
MEANLKGDAGEDRTFDRMDQSRYKGPVQRETIMHRRILSIVVVLAVGGLAKAQNFEVEPVMYRGDPKGSQDTGTLTKVAAPLLVIRSGESSSLLVGGSVPIQTPNGITFVTVGRQVNVTAKAVDGGGIKVEATFEHSELAGKGPQVTKVEAKTVATIQSGGSVRLELGKDPKHIDWVEITVRKAKR